MFVEADFLRADSSKNIVSRLIFFSNASYLQRVLWNSVMIEIIAFEEFESVD